MISSEVNRVGGTGGRNATARPDVFESTAPREESGGQPRRPLTTRRRGAPRRLAFWLAARGCSPNAVSVAGVCAALVGCACLLAAGQATATTRAVLLGCAAASIQLRLLANLLDGLIAVEGGRTSRCGELFNEIPDRIADVVLLAGAGYAISASGWMPSGLAAALGWCAVVLAVLTAYLRLLGGSLGQQQSFAGPMAKQHRMAVLTVSCLVSIVEIVATGFHGTALTAGLVVICIGTAVTLVRRGRIIVRRQLA